MRSAPLGIIASAFLADLPAEPVVVLDTFDRADETPLAAPYGTFEGLPYFNLSGNHAVGLGGYAAACHDTGQIDTIYEVVFTQATAQATYLFFSATTAVAGWHGLQLSLTPVGWALQHVDRATNPTIASGATPVSHTGTTTMTIEAEGQHYVVSLDGVVVYDGVYTGLVRTTGIHAFLVETGSVTVESVSYTEVWGDVVVTPHHGSVLAAPSFGAGKFANALTAGAYTITGVDSPIRTATAWSDDLTIEAWLKTTNSGVAVAIGCENAYWLGINGGQYTVHYGASAGELAISGPGGMNDGAWHHVAFVYRPGVGGQLFVDGISVGTAGEHEPGSSGGVAIGGFASTAYGWFGVGGIDEVRFSRTPRWTASFTPPVAAYVTDNDTIGLYHLESDGTDSC